LRFKSHDEKPILNLGEYMTKYAFIVLQLFLFCFIAFDFSSEAFAARACLPVCDGWDKTCVQCPSASSRNRSSSRNTPTSKKDTSYNCSNPSDTQLAPCEGRGWNPVECRCKTQAEVGSAQNNNSDSNSNNTSDSGLSNVVNSCKVARDAALDSCDQDQDTGMQGAQSALSNFATQAGSMGLGACTKLAPVLAGANAATVYFNQNCSGKRTSCMQSCTQARSRAAEISGMNVTYLTQQQGLIDAYYDECKKLDSKLAQSQQAIQGMVSTIPGVANCAASTNTDLYSYCASNPSALGCETVATDCSNPTVAASNQVCICKNNPNAAGCIGVQAKVSDMNAAGGGSADISSLSAGNAGGSMGADNPFSTLGWDGNGMTPSSGATESVGGKKGAGANLGGDSGGGVPGAGGGDGKSGGAATQALQVNSGFRGGGGGGGGWGGGSGSGGYGEDRPYNPKNSQAPGANGPNLRDFLPNGKMDPKMANRGLAGISGPDGITGPHSDIWKKIQNRYQIQVEKSALMP
jgi:hypothetical protein